MEIEVNGQSLEVDPRISVFGEFRPATREDPPESPEVELESLIVTANFSEDEVENPIPEGKDVLGFLSHQEQDSIAWQAFKEEAEQQRYDAADAMIDDCGPDDWLR